MSKQLALSIALSVMAMTAFALMGTGRTAASGLAGDLRLPISAKAAALPSLGHLIPALQ